ncbi:MAG: hypothetical protein HHAS10_10580 [Candidatus Altimarinota bacterium]
MPHIQEIDWSKHTNIALDVDETLATTLMPGLEDFHKMGKMLAFQDISQITEFNWQELDGCDITEEEFLTYWRMHNLKGILPVEDSIDGIFKLSEKGKLLHVITARNESDHGTDTHEWLGTYFPEIHPTHIHFVNHISKNSLPKSGLCKSYNISLLIDDGLHNALDVATKGISCILINKPWNQKSFDPHLPIYRVNSWKEIIQSLNRK